MAKDKDKEEKDDKKKHKLKKVVLSLSSWSANPDRPVSGELVPRLILHRLDTSAM